MTTIRTFVLLFVLLIMGCFFSDTEAGLTDENFVEKATYVGDESCKQCHLTTFRRYKSSQMGRSFSPIDADFHTDIDLSTALVKDTLNHFVYTFVKKDSAWFQREEIYNAQNELIHQLDLQVDYVVGSGDLNKSFIAVENGYTFELPVTWYAQKKKWDLSPGYRTHNPRFFRSITKECMECHNSPGEFVHSTENKFSSIAHGIGCESCHGAGEYHIQIMNDEKSSEISGIINPKKLDKKRQMDVCAQCHLQGSVHLFESDKRFRPSMELEKTKLIYMDENHQSPQVNIAGHVARLSYSECFKKSEMTCISCHDPHLPLKRQNAKAPDNCLSCHADRIESIINHSKNDNCVSCHMSKDDASDIPHVSVTDHWIRVRDKNEKSTFVKGKDSEAKIVEYYTSGSDSVRLGKAFIKKYRQQETSGRTLPDFLPLAKTLMNEDASANYELGIVNFYLGNYGETINYFLNVLQSGKIPEPDFYLYLAKSYKHKNNGKLRLYYLQKSEKEYPLYYPALIELSSVYIDLQKPNDALKVVNKVIHENPYNEEALYQRSFIYVSFLPNSPETQNVFKDFIHKYPYHHDGVLNYSVYLDYIGQTKEALKVVENVLFKFKGSVKMETNYVRLLLKSGQKEKAIELFKGLLKAYPKDPRVRALEEMLQT